MWQYVLVGEDKALFLSVTRSPVGLDWHLNDIQTRWIWLISCRVTALQPGLLSKCCTLRDIQMWQEFMNAVTCASTHLQQTITHSRLGFPSNCRRTTKEQNNSQLLYDPTTLKKKKKIIAKSSLVYLVVTCKEISLGLQQCWNWIFLCMRLCLSFTLAL